MFIATQNPEVDLLKSRIIVLTTQCQAITDNVFFFCSREFGIPDLILRVQRHLNK